MASSKTAKKRSKAPIKKKRSASTLKGKRAPRCTPVAVLDEEPPETEGGGGPGSEDNPSGP